MKIMCSGGLARDFFDILTESAINVNLANLELHIQLINQTNLIQKAIDEAGFLDTMIFV